MALRLRTGVPAVSAAGYDTMSDFVNRKEPH